MIQGYRGADIAAFFLRFEQEAQVDHRLKHEFLVHDMYCGSASENLKSVLEGTAHLHLTLNFSCYGANRIPSMMGKMIRNARERLNKSVRAGIEK